MLNLQQTLQKWQSMCASPIVICGALFHLTFLQISLFLFFIWEWGSELAWQEKMNALGSTLESHRSKMKEFADLFLIFCCFLGKALAGMI